ncbi:MAG TPA: hypothetical protein VMW50_08360 [Dehalococcoidia bacterium]|nr:hypothetical protein [Dehalococcoidia bacterium]
MEKTRFIILNKKLQKIDITRVIEVLQFYASEESYPDKVSEDKGKRAKSVLFKLGVKL